MLKRLYRCWAWRDERDRQVRTLRMNSSPHISRIRESLDGSKSGTRYVQAERLYEVDLVTFSSVCISQVCCVVRMLIAVLYVTV